MKNFKQFREGTARDGAGGSGAYYMTDNQSTVSFSQTGNLLITLNTPRDLDAVSMSKNTSIAMDKLRRAAYKDDDDMIVHNNALVAIDGVNIALGKSIEKLERKFKSDLIKTCIAYDKILIKKIAKL
jgi:hypothetical protein